MLPNSEERQRFNRRLRLLDKSLSSELKGYRQRISKPAAVEKRGVGTIFVPSGTSGFLEGADVIQLCHQFLDEHGVPHDTTQ